MKVRRYDLVLSIFPNTRGFAFVLFEGPFSPVDWGMSDVAGPQRNRTAVRLISAILRRHAPDLIVLRSLTGSAATHNRRLQTLIETIEELAEAQGLPVVGITREQVRAAFGYLTSPARYAIAHDIAKRILLFEQFVPPPRKIWKSEDRRMGLFDAAAISLTHYFEYSIKHI